MAVSILVACATAAEARSPSSPPANGKTADGRTIDAVAVAETSALRLDGALTDAVWQSAPVVGDFVQREPSDGAPPSFPTEVRVAYDSANLYVAVRATDPEPGKIVGLLTRRDEPSPSDWLRVIIDSYHDRRTAYEFAVNAAGVKQDKYWFNDGSEDRSWDAVWDVEVTRNASGWQAEFRIPFSQLRYNPRATTTFGFAVVRQIGRLNETATWPHLPRAANGYVSSFGVLNGVAVAGSPKRLELVPYSVAQVSTQPDGKSNPLVNGVDPGAALGVDVKYALTPGLTLTATMNPDFGQVEADPAVVNLSAFETFFGERRPFFVEGSGNLRFDINCSDGQCTGLFYSRRIGRPPQGSADTPDGGYSVSPAQTTIVGAAKLTGRVGRFSIGALNAVTSAERATLSVTDRRSRQTVEPATSYSVVRAKREFANQSSVGFMLTATNRRLARDVRFLPGQAYTGGADWDWRLTPKYSISGYWAFSDLRGDAAAIDRLQRNARHYFQRPDARHLAYDPLRTSLAGQAAFAAVQKIGGERVRFSSVAGAKSPGFDINDLGFFQRADERFVSNWLQWRFDRPSKVHRTFRVNFNQWAGWNFGGTSLWSGGNINAHLVLTSNWRFGSGVNVNRGGFDDRLTRGGPGGKRNNARGVWYYITGDDRHAVFPDYSGWIGGDGHGSHSYDLGPRVTFRPTSALSMSLGLRYSRNVDDYQWIEQVADARDHYVFGHLEQTTFAMTTRVNYTLTPDLSLQVYAEPFVSAGDYGGFKELVNGRARAYGDRFARFGYQGNPDFNIRSFRTTNVLRWEYKPGSTVFLVWQQAREETRAYGDFRFGRDLGGVFGAPGTNVFLVKIAYWFNY